jgi:hypothetical protein
MPTMLPIKKTEMAISSQALRWSGCRKGCIARDVLKPANIKGERQFDWTAWRSLQ